MKIVYITDALAIWGGLERILVEKVNELTKRYGYEMYLLTVNQGRHQIPYSLHPSVTHHDLNILFHKQYQYKGIRRLIKKFELNQLFKHSLKKQLNLIQPDVIVCVRSELIGVVAKVKGDTPLIYESHTSCHAQQFIHADWFTKMKMDWYNRSVRSAQQVVALTDGDAHAWCEINPNVSVIPNLVHLNPYRRYCDYNSKSVIFVGRFSAQKDITSLLKIWFIVYQRHPDWKLQIFGGYGEEENKLLPQIKQMDVNIIVHEPTHDIFKYYLENSILVLTSLYEPFGLVLPEAMSCGLPVVAFDCPYGPANIITHELDGFLVPERDINRFADYVCQLIESLDLRQTMGAAGVKAAQRYQADHIMPQWQDLFVSLTSKEPSSRRTI